MKGFGHIGGSVGYWWEQAGLLFSGDAVQCRGGTQRALPIIEEPASYPSTLSRIGDLRPTRLML